MSVVTTWAPSDRPTTQAPLGDAAAPEPSDWPLKTLIVLCSAGLIAAALMTDSHRRAVELLWSYRWGRGLLIAGGAYGSCTVFFMFWRLWLALRYRPCPVVDESSLPSVTVIVPAFNEGELVGRTIHRLAASDYPPDRLNIIVVDDGSTDDTWRHIQGAARRIGPRVTALHYEENRGKRWALWEGFRRGTGEVFVTVDSDSLVEPDAIRSLVSPIVSDPRVGAVAGNVRVLNRRDGLIPRMLAIRYVMTFDYKRAAQSMMGGGAVFCVAGALAAYRRTAVMPVLDDWLHQTYLGGQARAGEDHAMTNFVLGQGHHVRFQRTARVRTQSPTTYVGLAQMFLRWGRSNIRETVHMSRFMFRRFRSGRLIGIRFNWLMVATGLVVPYVFIGVAMVLAIVWPGVFGLKLLAACATGGLFSLVFVAVRERDSEALFAIPYAFYAVLLLGWVWPYALLTSHKSVWMTRSPRRQGRVDFEPLPQLAPVVETPAAVTPISSQ